MKRILILLVLAGTVSLWAAHAPVKAATPEEEAKAKKIAACEQKAVSTASSSCDAAAEKACKDKSSYTKTVCVKASKESCLAAAKKTCSA